MRARPAHQVATDPATLAHQLGLAPSDPISTVALLRAARRESLQDLSASPSTLPGGNASRLDIEPVEAFADQWTGDLKIMKQVRIPIGVFSMKSRHLMSGMAALAIGFFGASAAPVAHAKLVEEVVKVPVKVSNGYGKVSEQEIVVTLFYEDTMPKPYPIAIVNHGREVHAQQRAAMGRAKYSVNSAWLARLGFLVAVPTRVGYGVTGGDDVEDTGDCGRKNYPPGYEAAAVQTLHVLQQMRERPDTAKDRAVVIGQSFGGTTAITVAAKNPPGVQATINFAGGGGGNPVAKPQDPCAPWALEKMFADYGKTTRTPTLWVYTENDMYFGPKLPKQWFDAFKAVGGTGEYMLYPPLGKNGHGLFTLAPDIWRPRVLEFLQAHGYPDLKVPEPVVTKAAVNVEAVMSR